MGRGECAEFAPPRGVDGGRAEGEDRGEGCGGEGGWGRGRGEGGFVREELGDEEGLEGLCVGEGCDGGEVEVAEEVRGGHWDRECWCCCRRGGRG